MTWLRRAARPVLSASILFVLALHSGPGHTDDANRAPFALVDHTGRSVTDADFYGAYVLIFFGYTFCPDICPTDLVKMADAIDALGGDAARVQPLFVTIDPARDTVAVLADYVGHFHPRLIGLTGEPARLTALAALYGVRAIPYQEAAEDVAGDDYYLDHTGAMYLLGPDGGGLAYFQNEASAADITSLIQQFMARDGAESDQVRP